MSWKELRRIINSHDFDIVRMWLTSVYQNSVRGCMKYVIRCDRYDRECMGL